MNRRLIPLSFLLLFLGLPSHAAPSAAIQKITQVAGYQTLSWQDLIPKHWDPAKAFSQLDLSKMDDSDPRAMEALKKMKDAWNNAPVEPALNGKRVRIPGFIVPVEADNRSIREFLLVPYFGACIHSPPPPANQIVYVVSAKALKGLSMMDVVWVNGTLETARTQVDVAMGIGRSGYRLKADSVTPYSN